MTHEIQAAFIHLWNDLIERIPSLLAGIATFALFYLGSRVGAGVARKVASRTGMPTNLVELLVRVGAVVVLTFGLLLAAVIVFPAFKLGDLVAWLGLSSVAIGFAFKDILQNFIAGLFLLWRQPFRVGDEIVAGDYSGRVEEITARSTRIHTYDGERAVIPNADVYTQPVLVRTAYGKRRSRVDVGIGYADDLEKARAVVLEAVQAIEGVVPEPGPWVYVGALSASSVDLNVYFWTDDAQKEVLRVADRVVTRIKLALDDAGIDMPYPHRVVLLRQEGPAA